MDRGARTGLRSSSRARTRRTGRPSGRRRGRPRCCRRGGSPRSVLTNPSDVPSVSVSSSSAAGAVVTGRTSADAPSVVYFTTMLSVKNSFTVTLGSKLSRSASSRAACALRSAKSRRMCSPMPSPQSSSPPLVFEQGRERSADPDEVLGHVRPVSPVAVGRNEIVRRQPGRRHQVDPFASDPFDAARDGGVVGGQNDIDPGVAPCVDDHRRLGGGQQPALGVEHPEEQVRVSLDRYQWPGKGVGGEDDLVVAPLVGSRLAQGLEPEEVPVERSDERTGNRSPPRIDDRAPHSIVPIRPPLISHDPTPVSVASSMVHRAIPAPQSCSSISAPHRGWPEPAATPSQHLPIAA